MTSTRITRDDIEAKLRELEGGAEAPMGAARSGARAAAVVVVALVVVGAYVIGRRRGKRRNRTVVEVHRL